MLVRTTRGIRPHWLPAAALLSLARAWCQELQPSHREAKGDVHARASKHYELLKAEDAVPSRDVPTNTLEHHDGQGAANDSRAWAETHLVFVHPEAENDVLSHAAGQGGDVPTNASAHHADPGAMNGSHVAAEPHLHRDASDREGGARSTSAHGTPRRRRRTPTDSSAPAARQANASIHDRATEPAQNRSQAASSAHVSSPKQSTQPLDPERRAGEPRGEHVLQSQRHRNVGVHSTCYYGIAENTLKCCAGSFVVLLCWALGAWFLDPGYVGIAVPRGFPDALRGFGAPSTATRQGEAGVGKQRCAHLDNAKLILMFMVVFTHCHDATRGWRWNVELHFLVNPFCTRAFGFISGLCAQDAPDGDAACRIVFRMVAPLVLYCIIVEPLLLPWVDGTTMSTWGSLRES